MGRNITAPPPQKLDRVSSDCTERDLQSELSGLLLHEIDLLLPTPLLVG
jgi:hypothetical protein